MSNLPEWLNVPRETHTAWLKYLELLQQWNKTINLVADNDPSTWWDRHILDSAQLCLYLNSSSRIVDFGSGAGLPGMVLSLMGYENITFVESDKRKCAFLQHVCGEFNLKANVIPKRVEILAPLLPDAIISRAFAPLSALIDYSMPHFKKNTRCLFPKGKNYSNELDEVKHVTLEYFVHPSKLDPQSVVLEIYSITPI